MRCVQVSIAEPVAHMHLNAIRFVQWFSNCGTGTNGSTWALSSDAQGIFLQFKILVERVDFDLIWTFLNLCVKSLRTSGLDVQ